MKQQTFDDHGLHIHPTDRERLVRLCASLSGRADVADDLAQETLTEVWRQRHKLDDPSGQSKWIAAIARNVCARWRHNQGREHLHMADTLIDPSVDAVRLVAEETADDCDVEIEFERQELAELLDRALALLPPATRLALIGHYLEDLPQADIADRLGITEGAVAVKVHRGKLALRRILLSDNEIAASYLPRIPEPRWESTRLWCTVCGRRRLLGRVRGDPPVVALRCSSECAVSDGLQMESLVPDSSPSVGYGKAVSRVRALADRHYGLNRIEDVPRCLSCGHATPLQVGGPDGLPPDLQTPGTHVYLRCEACHTLTHSALSGLVLCLPQAQRFLRKHPRVRTLPEAHLEIDGAPALLSRFQSHVGASMDVLVRSDTFRLIATHITKNS